MAHSSPIDDDVRISGLNSETAAEIVSLIRAEIKASELHSRPSAAARGPTIDASAHIWAAAGTTIATATLVVGIFLWQLTDLREDMRADSQSIRMEIGSVRAEIGSVREEVGTLRGEVAALRERIVRVETLLLDRLPTSP